MKALGILARCLGFLIFSFPFKGRASEVTLDQALAAFICTYSEGSDA